MEFEKLQGTVERVTYHSEQSGYSVLKTKIGGHRDLITVVGSTSAVNPGESFEAWGEWVTSKDYGRQFKANSLKMIAPNTILGMEKYLGSGLVKGIGPHFAKKLVESFGLEVFNIIEKNPDKLLEIPGVGGKRVNRITSAWKDQKIIREIMIFLQGHGVSSSKSVRIFKTYGERSVEILKDNPYRLAKDIHGIGFKSADMIAQKLGVPKDSMKRARAGLEHVLLEKSNEGHCAYPRAKLLEEASQLLEISFERLHQALDQEISGKNLVLETQFKQERELLFLASFHHFESELAKGLLALTEGEAPWKVVDVEKALGWAQGKLQLALAPSQQEAIRATLGSRISIITGGPGTGKSTLTKALVQILDAKKVRLGLCSPTGRAAKRLSECTQMPAKTVHRLLGFDPKKGGFHHNQDNPLEIDFLIIDEASMLDLKLLYNLVKALPQHAGILFIGDVDQLPSVGAGQVLRDLIESKVFPTVRLTEIFRQAQESKIIKAAHEINLGNWPDLKPGHGDDFFFLECEDPEKCLELIEDLIERRLPQKYNYDPIKDIQVLCPMQRGSLGARNLNERLALKLNPHPMKIIEKFGTRFGIGDKIMVIENDYEKEVFNGDLGFILDLDLEEQECLVDIDGKEVRFNFSELDILVPAYTITIHKSQGSEFPVVILPLGTQHFMMLKRNLVYTGVTRGKKLVILVGSKKALAMAIKNKDELNRITLLKDRLQISNINSL